MKKTNFTIVFSVIFNLRYYKRMITIVFFLSCFIGFSKNTFSASTFALADCKLILKKVGDPLLRINYNHSWSVDSDGYIHISGVTYFTVDSPQMVPRVEILTFYRYYNGPWTLWNQSYSWFLDTSAGPGVAISGYPEDYVKTIPCPNCTTQKQELIDRCNGEDQIAIWDFETCEGICKKEVEKNQGSPPDQCSNLTPY